jgi:5,10-methylenetetrahydrofolate reductase
VVAAGIVPPAGGLLDDVLETVSGLRERGVGLFAVTPRENPRTHPDSLNLALHLAHHAGIETIATVTTWDKTIMTLQADLLGAHALGIRGVVCTTGSPPVLGDYPAVDGVWEVDSLGLTALLAGLNDGRDSNGLPLTAKTSFCIGARVNPGAPDRDAEIARARAKVDAGARFLVSRPVSELGPLRDLVAALGPGGVPVLLSITPLRSFEEAEYLANEVPDVSIPARALRAMERAGRGSARAAGAELAAELLHEARPVAGGVVLTALDGDVTALLPLLAAAG